MLKKSLFLLLLLGVTGCTWWSDFYVPEACPLVEIPRDRAYLTQKAGSAEDFQIQITGFETYCDTRSLAGRSFAYITPLFEVSRLRQTDETDVDFAFYTETLQGPPEYLGKRVYYASVTIGENEQRRAFKGQTVKVKVPADNPEHFPVILGLELSRAQYLFNQRAFDLKYRNNSDQVPQYIERTRISETPAPKASTGGCGSCRL